MSLQISALIKDFPFFSSKKEADGKKKESWRHEWKYAISASEKVRIRRMLQVIAQTDQHAVNGRYRISSLYFDNIWDTALYEKIDGVNDREKFRIRYYDGDTSLIHLEKKRKRNGMCFKSIEEISKDEAQKLIDGDLDWMLEHGNPDKRRIVRSLTAELYAKMRCEGIAPKVIVDYLREAYIYDAGNVRVTFDSDLRVGFQCGDFLKSDCELIPAGIPPLIMEVKWNGFLPRIIQDAIRIPNCRPSVQAFSKYAQCRIFR